MKDNTTNASASVARLVKAWQCLDEDQQITCLRSMLLNIGDQRRLDLIFSLPRGAWKVERPASDQ